MLFPGICHQALDFPDSAGVDEIVEIHSKLIIDGLGKLVPCCPQTFSEFGA